MMYVAMILWVEPKHTSQHYTNFSLYFLPQLKHFTDFSILLGQMKLNTMINNKKQYKRGTQGIVIV